MAFLRFAVLRLHLNTIVLYQSSITYQALSAVIYLDIFVNNSLISIGLLI
jgi:hypothetical protein